MAMALPTDPHHDGRAHFLSPADDASPHVSQVFAWYGFPDDPQPRLLSINGLPAVWKGPTLDRARQAATEALDARDVPTTWAPEASVAQEAFRETNARLRGPVPGPVGPPVVATR